MMRKLILAVLLFGTLPALARAGIFEEDGVVAHYVSPSSIATSTAAIIVDLSDTANWPHKQATYARILSASIYTDQVAAGTSTIKLGVITSVNASSGTVSWFMTQDNTLNVSNTNKVSQRFFKRLDTDRNSSNITRNFITNDKTDASSTERTLFQTDVLLPTSNGTFIAPNVGDIVAVIFGANSAPKVYITLEYVTP